MQTSHSWSPNRQGVLLLLAKGMSKERFQEMLDSYPFEFEEDITTDNRMIIRTIRREEIGKDFFIIISITITIGLMILLVALFNIISFQTAQFFNRLRECALRKFMGANKKSLFVAFYMEIILIFIISYILSLILLEFLESILHLYESRMPFPPSMVAETRTYVTIATLFGLLVTSLFCLIPIKIINNQSVRVVFFGLHQKVNKQRGRKILLLIQMSFMLLFLSATLLLQLQSRHISQNLWHTLSKDEKKNINYIYVRAHDLDVMVQNLRMSSAVADILICDGGFYSDRIDGGTGQMISIQERRFRLCVVDYNFPEFFNAKLLMGRWWTQDDPYGLMVVDKTFADTYPDGNPIGEHLMGRAIIGVIEYIQMGKEQKNSWGGLSPVIYNQLERNESRTHYAINIKSVQGRQAEVKQLMQQLFKDLYPERTYHEENFLDITESVMHAENTFSHFFGLFSVICLILCLMTIYSAIIMNIEKRRKEIIIRKINGATIKDIIWLFCKTYLILWTIVCVIIFPVVYYAGNLWISTFTKQYSMNFWFFSGIYMSVACLIFAMIIFRILEVAYSRLVIGE
jgi:hypothetical protein